MSKPRIFSGVQPSGSLHIGNYLGAITQFVALQDEYDCIYCVVDYHAITVKQDPVVLKKNIIEIAKLFITSGIDPKKSIIFQQSALSEHTELAWIMNCVARMSDLNKMTQFKDKAGGEQENVSIGLFDYPALMAADILLYDTEVVPVGEDQTQHVEFTRDLGKRFNHQFSEIFKLPKVKLLKEGARIMGLDDATKKMSKSAPSEANYIALLDEPEKAAKKIMRAETDSETRVRYDITEKPGISNLLTIHSLLTNKSISEIEGEYKGKGYGDFKKGVAESVKEFLTEFQAKYNEISDKVVRKVLDEGAEKARKIAAKKLKEIKESIGIL